MFCRPLDHTFVQSVVQSVYDSAGHLSTPGTDWAFTRQGHSCEQRSRLPCISRLFASNALQFTSVIENALCSTRYQVTEETGETHRSGSYGRMLLDMYGSGSQKVIEKNQLLNPDAVAKYDRSVYEDAVGALTTTIGKVETYKTNAGFGNRAQAIEARINEHSWTIVRVVLKILNYFVIARLNAAEARLNRIVADLTAQSNALAQEMPEEYCIGIRRDKARTFAETHGPVLYADEQSERANEIRNPLEAARIAFTEFLVKEAAEGRGLTVYNPNLTIRPIPADLTTAQALAQLPGIQSEILSYNTNVLKFLRESFAHDPGKLELIEAEFNALYSTDGNPSDHPVAISAKEFGRYYMMLSEAVLVTDNRRLLVDLGNELIAPLVGGNIFQGRDLCGDVLGANGFGSLIHRDDADFQDIYDDLVKTLADCKMYVARREDGERPVPGAFPKANSFQFRLNEAQRARLGQAILANQTTTPAQGARPIPAKVNFASPSEVMTVYVQRVEDWSAADYTEQPVDFVEAMDLLDNLGYTGPGGLGNDVAEGLAQAIVESGLKLTYYAQIPDNHLVEPEALPYLVQQRVHLNSVIRDFFTQNAASALGAQQVGNFAAEKELQILTELNKEAEVRFNAIAASYHQKCEAIRNHPGLENEYVRQKMIEAENRLTNGGRIIRTGPNTLDFVINQNYVSPFIADEHGEPTDTLKPQFKTAFAQAEREARAQFVQDRAAFAEAKVAEYRKSVTREKLRLLLDDAVRSGALLHEDVQDIDKAGPYCDLATAYVQQLDDRRFVAPRVNAEAQRREIAKRTVLLTPVDVHEMALRALTTDGNARSPQQGHFVQAPQPVSPSIWSAPLAWATDALNAVDHWAANQVGQQVAVEG